LRRVLSIQAFNICGKPFLLRNAATERPSNPLDPATATPTIGGGVEEGVV
jgi:hypothetical protein